MLEKSGIEITDYSKAMSKYNLISGKPISEEIIQSIAIQLQTYEIPVQITILDVIWYLLKNPPRTIKIVYYILSILDKISSLLKGLKS